jgi:hypothetical protein
MRPRDVFVEIGDDLGGRLDGVALLEGRSAPELLALGLQLVLGLGSGARGVLDWMGAEATPEERVAILRAMGRQAVLAQGEIVMARMAARMSAQEIGDLIPAAEMAVPAPVLLDGDAPEHEEFGELWEAF